MSDLAEGWYDDPEDGAVERFWDGSQWTGAVRQKFAPGWYDDPKDEAGQERYWDGAAWTHDVRPKIAPGWYADPNDQGQERYWDGAAWTADVRSKFAPGWYDDPQRFGAERYWDGSGWTEEQRFVTRLEGLYQAIALRRKDLPLVVSGAHLAWGDESVRWDDVTGFDSITGLVNGVPTSYVATITAGDRSFKVELAAGRGDQRTAQAFATIVDQAHRLVTPRILTELFRRADAGEVIEYEKLTLSPNGVAKGGKDPVPWNEYAGWRTQNAQLDIEKMKGDKRKVAFRVTTTHLGRWVLTALLDDYAKRMASA